VGHIERMRGMRIAYKILVEILERKDHSKELRVDAVRILQWVLGKEPMGIGGSCPGNRAAGA